MLEQVLRQSGHLHGQDIERALRHADEHQVALDEALAALGLIEADELVLLVGQHVGGPCLGGSRCPKFEPKLKNVLPNIVAERFRAIPLERSGKLLRVAVEDPREVSVRDKIASLTRLDVELVAALPSVVDAGLWLLYGLGNASAEARKAAAAPASRPASAAPPPAGSRVVSQATAPPPPAQAEKSITPPIPSPGAGPASAPEAPLPGWRLREIPASILELLSAETARNYQALPLELVGQTLLVAVADPRDIKTVRALQFATNCFVSAVRADSDVLRRAITRHYPARVDEDVDVSAEAVDPDALSNVSCLVRELLTPDQVREYRAVPISLVGNRLTVAMVNPSDLGVVLSLEFVTGRSVTAVSIEPELFALCLERYYPAGEAEGVASAGLQRVPSGR